LLKPNGLGFVEENDFIYVYTAEELTALGLDAWNTVTRVIYLDYLRPEDARNYVRHLLSEAARADLNGDGSPDGIEITRDLDPDSESAGGQVAVGGLEQGGQEDAGSRVYTPALDQFALRSAIIVHDYLENVDRIQAFIEEMDTQPAQVLIEASIIQTSLTEENAFGIDFAMLNGINFTSFFNIPFAMPGSSVGSAELGVKTSSSVDMATGQINQTTPNSSQFKGFGISNPGQTGSGDATFRGGYVNGNFGIFIRALDRVTDVTLLSNPKILTLNRQRARVMVGTRVGYLETTTVENQVNSTIKFIDTGIILDIRPFILRDGRVRLELAPKVSEVTFRPPVPVAGEPQIPDETIETINTDVLVPEGYTAVIGGLFREDTSRERNQVPLLGDLPLAGALFRGHDDRINQVEIIFLIKPTVLKDRVLEKIGRRGEEFGEMVRVGGREGLLPWSRERQSAKLNLEADRLLAMGKPRKAMHKLRRSLELHSNQPQVMLMRKEILGDPAWWPGRTFLDRYIFEDSVFDDETDEPAEPEAESATETGS